MGMDGGGEQQAGETKDGTPTTRAEDPCPRAMRGRGFWARPRVHSRQKPPCCDVRNAPFSPSIQRCDAQEKNPLQ